MNPVQLCLMQSWLPHSALVRQAWADVMLSHLSVHSVRDFPVKEALPQHFFLPSGQSADSSQSAVFFPHDSSFFWHFRSEGPSAQQWLVARSQTSFPHSIFPGLLSSPFDGVLPLELVDELDPEDDELDPEDDEVPSSV